MRSRRGEKLLRLIDRYADTLNEAECRMVNYDIWTPNIIVQETAQGKKFWWIDPERSFWGWGGWGGVDPSRTSCAWNFSNLSAKKH